MKTKYNKKTNTITLEDGTVIDVEKADELWQVMFDTCGIEGVQSDGGIYVSDGVIAYPDDYDEPEPESKPLNRQLRRAEDRRQQKKGCTMARQKGQWSAAAGRS